MTDSDALDAVFAALAHPVRRSILATLAHNEATVNELAAPFDISLPAVSRHIRVLEDAGLVVRGRNAQFRPCRLDAEPLKAVHSWTKTYRPIWEDRFDRMEAILSNKERGSDD